ncbi:hypothetical protein PENTCL1PPCAC_26893 [Pristionchus entomophagus]|uniref:JmjC domain-containing protein n=1 Tax=Pristionchus entomophagus TaxID=358040 RepID=A0AAV5UFI8_9BILA|nr:hypothetical protein PENTCL1PPCAC_26893 [Pristionchus entomophagus]
MDPMEEDDGISLNHINVGEINLTPTFMPNHEVIPRLTLYERVRLDTLTSINFLEFQGNINIIAHPERQILFKGFRILEKRLNRLMVHGDIEEKDKLDAFLVYLKLGHICLLAGDYARALSTYQHALRLGEEHFWKDSGAYFGLGIVYLHFKAYGSAIEAFNRHLYNNSTSMTASEANARLGVCYKAVKLFPDALRHFHSALNDRVAPHFLSHPQLKLNIALTHDSAGDIDKAYRECNDLLEDTSTHTPNETWLMAAIQRELGWLCYRKVDADQCQTSDERRAKLAEAEQHLHESKRLSPDSGKTHYYLGRCYGEQTPAKAHDAFLNYRASIDKSESDSDTWCSIGVLYHQQNQPMDALQAFICAVDLDPEHSAAWTNLGNLYETHYMFADALTCYKKAIKYNPSSPETLSARISVIQNELQQSPALLNQQPRTGPYLQSGCSARLPALKEAGSQPIPAELRQRQEEFIRSKQQRYRDGSVLWRMGELANTRTDPPLIHDNRMLNPSELNMLRIFKYAESKLDLTCQRVLENLEARLKQYGCTEGVDLPICKYTISELKNHSDVESETVLQNFSTIFDIDDDGNPVVKPKEEVAEDASEEEKERPPRGSDRATVTHTELPHSFSLLAPLKISVDVTAEEVMEKSNKRVTKPNEFTELFVEKVAPPSPPTPPEHKPGEILQRPTPIITIESRKDAHSIELHKFCESSPIVLIRGLATQLKMDLSLFSTKTLLETCPDHEVEVRTQYKMPPDLNVNHLGLPTWSCDSQQGFTTIRKYAEYQAENFKRSLKEESDKIRCQSAKYGVAETALKRRKMMEENSKLKEIKFGTNVDLSDDVKFKAQLTELAKMPPFCRVIAGCNLLSHLGHTILGMNTVQLYMKVPGNRTPGHTENNCLASVNINIGPGDCEWFGVPYEYWGVIDKKCREEGTDFLKGAWWPNQEELIQMGVPVYRFTQKPGDLVWVGAGCVHWVQSTGWCNNVAWNVGPMTFSQMMMAVHQYEWNKVQNYKSLVPMQHLFWQIAKNVRLTNSKVYNLVRGMLIRSLSYCKMIVDWAERHNIHVKYQPRMHDEHSHYCCLCQVEVFNLLFVKEEEKAKGTYGVWCVDCARRGNIMDYSVLQQINFVDLNEIFNKFQLHMISKTTLVV